MVISESTYDLLKKNQWIFDTFDMQEHRDVEIGVIGKSIKSYRVEQIFAADYSSSDDGEGLLGGGEHDEEDDEDENNGSDEEDEGKSSEDDFESPMHDKDEIDISD